MPLSFSPSLSFEKFFREGRAAWNGGARSRWNGGKLISADEEKKIKIFTASVFSLEWPLRSWIIVTTQFRGGVNRILGWIGSWSGEWEGKERIDSRGWNSEMKQSERERKRGGWCGGGRKWRFCKRVRGISSVIWGREDRGGGQFSRDDTEAGSVSGVDTGPFSTLRVDRVNTWTWRVHDRFQCTRASYCACVGSGFSPVSKAEQWQRNGGCAPGYVPAGPAYRVLPKNSGASRTR